MEEFEINQSQPIKEETTKENIEVWEDLVHIKSLILALCICSATTLGGYFIAPNEPPKPLFFGLTGAVIGFVICSFLIKPKRTFRYPALTDSKTPPQDYEYNK